MVAKPLDEVVVKSLEILCFGGKERAVHVGLAKELEVARELEVVQGQRVVAVVHRGGAIGSEQRVHVGAAAWHVIGCRVGCEKLFPLFVVVKP